MWVGGFTVDVRNPAPVDMANIHVFTVFYTSQLVHGDFPSIPYCKLYLSKPPGDRCTNQCGLKKGGSHLEIPHQPTKRPGTKQPLTEPKH